MTIEDLDNLDIFVRDALSSWRRLDVVDVQILEGISHINPRNISQVAHSISLPQTTVRFRMMRMIQNSFLFLHLVPNTEKMGLKRTVIFVEAAPGYEIDLIEYLQVNDFWIFMCQVYGKIEGSASIWTIPHGKTMEFQSFLEKLLEIGVAKNFEIMWTTPFHYIPVNGRWFDPKEKTWIFNWNEWIDEIETIEGELPDTLTKNEKEPMRVDITDLQIIAELENNALLTFSEISKILGIPQSKIKYHYYEHIIKKGLVAGHQVETYPYPFPICEIPFFKFEFDNPSNLKKFILSLLDKPIAINVGKVIGENSLISHIYLPKWELRRLTRALSILEKRGLLKRYDYYLQDMYQTFKETIPFENYESNEWSYNLDRQLKKIEDLHSARIL
jgi:DNA-binding Lrp family transcriptional regulator